MSALASVLINKSVVKQVALHGKRECDKGGYECVGFLAETEGVIVATLPFNNHSSDPTHTFFVEPWEQFRAEQALTKRGYTISGVYHSHTMSEASPSRSDIAMARPGELMAIYSVVFDELRFYRESDGKLEPVEYEEYEED